jgi:hypothetical protein
MEFESCARRTTGRLKEQPKGRAYAMVRKRLAIGGVTGVSVVLSKCGKEQSKKYIIDIVIRIEDKKQTVDVSNMSARPFA